MSIPLAGYRTTSVLRDTGPTRVYEAQHEDGHRVVAKVFDIDSPQVEARVEHEFALLESLDIEGVVKTLELRRVGNVLVLLLERVEGVNLANYANGRRLDLDEFFGIALQLVDILASTHARRVVHRDIKPSNILIEPDSGRVFLADFGISVLLQNERRNFHNPEVLTGSLPYLSPEQTGRTGHGVDFRSDLYSLGVTFYELLTGRRPFTELEPLALIHAHLACVPVLPESLRPELPEALSRLVMKLVTKAPEHRYQTAAGLAVDLRALRDGVRDGPAFELGQTDFPAELRLARQTYGRAREHAALVTLLDAAIKSQTPRWVILRGDAGMGKSAILGELGAPVVGRSGYLGRGRFESFGKRPYDGLVEAFTDLFEQLLTEDEAELRGWRDRLRSKLGGVGRVLCELMPMLTLIIGDQPDVPELGPVETRKRLELAFTRLLEALGQAKRPVVLTLDDLDNADASCLELLDTLRRQPGVGQTLIVASTRASEPLAQLRTLLDGASADAQIIELGPLDAAAVRTLLADLLGRPLEVIAGLADIVARKTGSTPSLIEQFLMRLVDEGVLEASPGGWRWDERAVDEVQLPDDLVAVVRERIVDLEPATRELLECASCVGVRVSLRELQLLCAQPINELVVRASELVELGLLADAGTHYRFGHDDIRTAVYAGLEPERRCELHRSLGEWLRGRLDADATDARVFAAADQLNACQELDTDTSLDARVELARLNLDAGQRASDSAAHDAALRYFGAGVMLVSDLAVEVGKGGPELLHYHLVVSLRLGHAQNCFFAADPAEAEAAMDELLAWKLTTAHHAEAVTKRIKLLRLQERHEEAVDLGVTALQRYGLRINPRPGVLAALLGFGRGWWAIRTVDISSFPVCEDERALAIMSVVRMIMLPAYRTRFVLYPYLAGLVLRETRAAGYNHHFAATLGPAAMIASMLGWRGEALRLYNLQAVTIERMPNDFIRGEALMTAEVVRRLLFNPRVSLEHVPRLIVQFQEVGLVDFADGLLGAVLFGNLEYGMHLRVLVRRLEVHIERVDPATGFGMIVRALHGFACLLAESEADPAALVQREAWLETMDDEKLRSRGGPKVEVCLIKVMRARYWLLTGDLDAATSGCLELLAEVRQIFFGAWPTPQAALSTAIACAWVQLFEGKSTRTFRRGFRKSLAIVKSWAGNSPEGYGHYLDFCLGLRAALRGRSDDALTRLEQARAGAHAEGCRWVEGLAAETLARLAAAKGLTAFAAGATQYARSAYSAWGVELELPWLQPSTTELAGSLTMSDANLGGSRRSSLSRTTTSTTTTTISVPFHPGAAGAWAQSTSAPEGSVSSGQAPDFAAVLATLGVISEDLRLAEVITRLLETAVTSTAADHGKLLLKRDGELVLVAVYESGVEARLLDHPHRARDAGDALPGTLINFVARTRAPVVLDDVASDLRFRDDVYFTHAGVRSALALPVTKGERELGLLLLENRLNNASFTTRSIATLRMIAAQAASTLENAQLYAALSTSEARWRALVDGSPDLIILLDESGQVIFLNRQDAMSSPDAFVDRLRTGAPAARWDATFSEVLAHGEQREFELELEAASGADPALWYAVRFAAINLASDVALGRQDRARNIIVLATDISARKRSENDKRMLENQVRQQQRLESIGTLASGVAHEINNPIQGIMNYAELISLDSSGRALVKEFAAEIDHECTRVSRIVRNLLAFSRKGVALDEGHEHVEVAQMIEATVSLIQALLRKDEIELVLDIAEQLPTVSGDSQQLQQVVMNLVTNARDALAASDHERPLITIRARKRPIHGRAGVRISVEDCGPGIPPQLLGQIFDPFFTTKGRHEGTGLGLSVSHGIVQEHGGELTVDSTLGQGTAFFIDLATGESQDNDAGRECASPVPFGAAD